MNESKLPSKGDVFIPLFASMAKSDIEVVDLKESWSIIRFDNVVTEFRLDGQFPAIEQCIPKDTDVAITFTAEGMEFLRTAAQVAKSPSYKAIIRADGSIESDFGRQENAVSFTGTPFAVAFNAKYLVDAITFTGLSGEATVHGISPMNPLLIKNADSSRQSIVMPIQIKE